MKKLLRIKRHIKTLKKKKTDLTNIVAEIAEKGFDFLLSIIWFTDNTVYQKLLVVAPILSSPILESNKKKLLT